MTEPIRLPKWLTRNTKPQWDWKAKGSDELSHFGVPFAVKEYVQNIVGQILKDLQRREWDGWNREDLQETPIEERMARKRSLTETYPSILTGPHAICLRNKDWFPLYIMSANIEVKPKTNLMAAIVLWSTAHVGGRNALTFFINHLDEDASFESFVIDGESTSKDNVWAVGEKGKGFILATQYLAEYIDKVETQDHSPKLGISFRVGEQIGELSWKKSRSRKAASLSSLRVTLDDLTTRTVGDYLEHRYHLDIDTDSDGAQPEQYDRTKETHEMREKAAKLLDQLAKRRSKLKFNGPNDTSVVRSDEVCITIIGIAAEDSKPQSLFSAIFGIIPPTRRWRVAGSPTLFEFFIHGETPQFYHRDQLVPYGLHLNKLSLNYHGDLRLSSERAMVLNDRTHFPKYKKALCTAIHRAFQTLPELAIELADDILTDNHSDGFAWILSPPDKKAAAQYISAFETVWRRKLSIPLAEEVKFHPCAEDNHPSPLVSQLGLKPVMVSSRVLVILQQSGAYEPIHEWARRCLLDSNLIPDFSGLDRLRAALRTLIPTLPSDTISVRQYQHSYPTVVWDQKNNLIALARPKPCQEHPAEECFCWIGPALHDITKEYPYSTISTTKLWSVFATLVGGNTTGKQVAPATPMDTSGESDSNSNVSTQVHVTPRSPARASANNRPVVIPKQPYRAASNTGSSAAAKSSLPNPSSGSTPRATNNAPRTAHKQATAPSALKQPAQSAAETTASNQVAVARISKAFEALLGFDPIQKYDEVANKLQLHETIVADQVHRIAALDTSIAAKSARIEELGIFIAAKDTRIAELEEVNRNLQEDWAEEETLAAKILDNARKRKKTVGCDDAASMDF
ncbi:hypothetical protein C8R45DRAFT_871983 [Mycena sanguinolenta]|nr:hypothetical protein C8R45DRAFT_871983 [Mycena sanguinolenta]